MEKEKVKNDIQVIQDRVDSYGFKGQNEYDLHLREEIADYILSQSTEPKEVSENVCVCCDKKNTVYSLCMDCVKKTTNASFSTDELKSKAEELFLSKYGNKITASESWVIRYAIDFALSLPNGQSDAVGFLEWVANDTPFRPTEKKGIFKALHLTEGWIKKTGDELYKEYQLFLTNKTK